MGSTVINCAIESKSRSGKTATLDLRSSGVIFVASSICANEKLVLTRGELETIKRWCEAQLIQAGRLPRALSREYAGEVEGCGGDAELDRMVR